MKFGFRFFLSWIFSACIMFGLFYTWHGLFLNDFKRIQFPLSWFVNFAAFTYLILGAGIYVLYESSLMRRIRNFIARGVVCGVISGFCLFMVATVIHISLTRHLLTEHLLIDCAWQIAEQLAGAMVIVFFKITVREAQPESI